MNRTLNELRRYDLELDRGLREMEAEARLSDEESAHAMGGLVALLAVAAVVVAGIAAVMG